MLRHLSKCHPDLVARHNNDKAQSAVKKGEDIRKHVTYGGQFFQCYLKWMVMTYQPLNTCENKLFRSMCSELCPKVKHIDRHTLVSKMSEQAARVKATLAVELKGNHFSLTCDHWTSIAGTSYLGVTVHYIDEEWRLISLTLSCTEHTGSSKAPDVLRVLREAWESYDLKTSFIVGVVTDTAPVMGLFGRQLPDGVPHLYCVDHVVELTTVRIFNIFTFHFTFSFHVTLFISSFISCFVFRD